MSFEKLAIIYVFCNDFHSGQWDRLYRIQSRIGKQLRIKGDWQQYRENSLYDYLVREYTKETH